MIWLVSGGLFIVICLLNHIGNEMGLIRRQLDVLHSEIARIREIAGLNLLSPPR